MATPTLDRPAPNPDNNKNRKFLESPKKVIAILLGTGAIGLFGYQALDRDMTGTVHDIADNAKDQYDEKMADRGYDVTNGDPVRIEVPQENENSMEHIAVQYPTTIVAQGEALDLLNAHSRNFDEWRQMSLDLLIKDGALSADQIDFLSQHLATLSTKSDKSDYTSEEILAAVHLDIFDATAQPNGSVGTAMLPTVLNKGVAGTSGVETAASDGDLTSTIDFWSLNGAEYERPKDHYFQGDDFGQVKDARVIVRSRIENVGEADTAGNKPVISVYVLNSDGNGNEQWQLYKNYDWDDQSARDELHSLHPQNQGR
jgi:hypothetical protein